MAEQTNYGITNARGSYIYRVDSDVLLASDNVYECVKISEGDVNVGPFSNKIQTWDKIALRYDELYRSLLKGDMRRAHT